ncbi:DsbA family protein [Leuconostoc citreum]
MLDIYQFSNPLSTDCLKTEERLLQLSYDLSERVHLRFIPLLDHHLVAKLTPSYLRDSTTDNNDQKVVILLWTIRQLKLKATKSAPFFN